MDENVSNRAVPCRDAIYRVSFRGASPPRPEKTTEEVKIDKWRAGPYRYPALAGGARERENRIVETRFIASLIPRVRLRRDKSRLYRAVIEATNATDETGTMTDKTTDQPVELEGFREEFRARLEEIGDPRLSAAFALRVALAALQILVGRAGETTKVFAILTVFSFSIHEKLKKL